MNKGKVKVYDYDERKSFYVTYDEVLNYYKNYENKEELEEDMRHHFMSEKVIKRLKNDLNMEALKMNKYLKHDFTCENKKDINILVEEFRDDYEEYHKGETITIIDVTFKHLTIGLIKVTITYDV